MPDGKTPVNPANVKPGKFITFEGGEGSGKSTQVQRLMARLAARGIEVVVTREPGGSPLAERYRKLLLSGAVAPMGPVAEAIAFTAARIDHIDATIRPAIFDGCFVLCDRFADSTRAYQGSGGKVDPTLLDELQQAALGDLKPDLTLILDLPAKDGLARAQSRGEADRFEQEDLSFHEKVRQSFLETARREPGRCIVIDAGRTPAEVEEAVWKAVSVRLLDKRADGDETTTSRSVGRSRAHLRVIEGHGASGARPQQRKPGKLRPEDKSRTDTKRRPEQGLATEQAEIPPGKQVDRDEPA